MNLRFVRTFVAIADAGGIARAGARLNLSQPAASRQIAALETSLGVKLFDRIGRRFRLTSEGEYLLAQCRRILMDAESLAVEAEALKKGQTGLLRVGATSQMIESMLAVFLARYRRRHPGVEVQLVEEGGLRVADLLARGDVHLAMTLPDERFQQQPLFPIWALGVLSEKHPLSRRRTLDVAALAHERVLLLLNRSFGTRGWFDAACGTARIHPDVIMESAAPHTLIALGRAGYGIAIVPSTVLIPRGVRPLPLVRDGLAIGSWATISRDPVRFLAPYAKEFADELATHCRRVRAGREFARLTPPLPKALARA